MKKICLILLLPFLYCRYFVLYLIIYIVFKLINGVEDIEPYGVTIVMMPLVISFYKCLYVYTGLMPMVVKLIQKIFNVNYVHTITNDNWYVYNHCAHRTHKIVTKNYIREQDIVEMGAPSCNLQDNVRRKAIFDYLMH